MTTIYEHATDTSCIEAVKLRDGGTDIIMTRDFGTTQESVALHTLPHNECDKLGAVLCKGIIDNYRERNIYLRKHYEDSQTTIRDGINEHNQHTHQLCARIEYLEAINNGHYDCKEAFFKLLYQRSELETTNRGLEQDIENLRIANSLYRKRWNEHEHESKPPESRGTEYDIRSRNFSRMVSGYRGMLSRNGKTITITLPFEHESVARNAEKYIVGAQRIDAKLRED